jgi:hypothetical protein
MNENKITIEYRNQTVIRCRIIEKITRLKEMNRLNMLMMNKGKDFCCKREWENVKLRKLWFLFIIHNHHIHPYPHCRVLYILLFFIPFFLSIRKLSHWKIARSNSNIRNFVFYTRFSIYVEIFIISISIYGKQTFISKTEI